MLLIVSGTEENDYAGRDKANLWLGSLLVRLLITGFRWFLHSRFRLMYMVRKPSFMKSAMTYRTSIYPAGLSRPIPTWPGP
jgi:hypothetical protein